MVTVLQYRPSVRVTVQLGLDVEDEVKRMVCQFCKGKTWAKSVTPRQCWEAMEVESRKASVMDAIYREGWDSFSVPTGVLLDKYWATDTAPIYRGWHFAIDVTIKNDHKALRYKAKNQARLSNVPVPGGIDRTAIWVIDPANMPTTERVKFILSEMVKQQNFTEVYYL